MADMPVNPTRLAKFQRVAQHRQQGLTVVLENVVDQHNLGAVLRSCDSVGIQEVFILYSEPDLKQKNIERGRKTARGVQKWMDIHFYTDTAACFQHLRESYDQIYATRLGPESQTLYELNLSQSVALLFGNELSGLSEESLAHADANFIIPQVGMSESLNISVACAVSVYEAYRQRSLLGWYGSDNPLPISHRDALYQSFLERNEASAKRRKIQRGINPDSLING